MIFAASLGSNGSGAVRYMAYLPFVLATGASLKTIQNSIATLQSPFGLNIEELENFYALTAGPFETDVEATRHLELLRAALLWLSLAQGVGVSYSRVNGGVQLYDTPIPISEPSPIFKFANDAGWTATDGHYDADKAAVRPEHMRLTRWEMGRPSVILSISVDQFFATVGEALESKNLSAVSDNPKLKLAIELYAAFRFELSENAQLLTLVSSLESLLPDVEIDASAKTALAEATRTIKSVRDNHASGSSEWTLINKLLSRVANLKRQSIGTTLRDYASGIVSRYPELGQPIDIEKKLTQAYSVRSHLLHEGHSDDQHIRESLSFLREFVPRFLAVQFREIARAV